MGVGVEGARAGAGGGSPLVVTRLSSGLRFAVSKGSTTQQRLNKVRNARFKQTLYRWIQYTVVTRKY